MSASHWSPYLAAILESFVKPFALTFILAAVAVRTLNNVRVVGVTGSIASGKSAFCRLLCRHGAGLTVVDADELARSVTAAGMQ